MIPWHTSNNYDTHQSLHMCIIITLILHLSISSSLLEKKTATPMITVKIIINSHEITQYSHITILAAQLFKQRFLVKGKDVSYGSTHPSALSHFLHADIP